MRLRTRPASAPGSLLLRAMLGAAVAACSLSPRIARADDEAATAQALFDQATALKANEDWAGACPKFESSYRLDPALGTLLNLANCFEKLGKIASAWARWEEAYQWATKNGDDRAEYAKTQRLRGYSTGFFMEAIAGVDLALWDILPFALRAVAWSKRA